MYKVTDNELITAYREAANIPPWELEKLVHQSNNDMLQVAQALVHENWLGRDQAGQLYADRMHSTYVNLGKTLLQTDIAQQIPKAFSEKHKVLPIYKFGAAVTVAMANPHDNETRLLLEQLLMSKVSPVFSFPDEISRAAQINLESEEEFQQMVKELDVRLLQTNTTLDEKKIQALVKSEKIIELANSILLQAFRDAASDLHIECKRHIVVVRFRIDGILIEKFRLPVELAVPIIARYKIMARMDIVDRKKPQDGRFRFELPAKSVDMRISTIPTLHGEKAVIRILGMRFTEDMLRLENMNMFPSILRPLKSVLGNSDGMLLVSGPTGSGKTTLLYAALAHINRPSLNIVTIEDPVEYENTSLNQVMVNKRDGRTFELALRSVLRQDPDVILVGEIRDLETARIVAQAAMTGHLVLSTIHTGSALQAVTRLSDMGVERFIVAPSIIGVLGQRLVRQICEYCRESYEPDPEYLRRFFFWSDSLEIPQLYRGAGCKNCHNTGYRNRMAIHELLVIDDKLRHALLSGVEYDELKALAKKRGYQDVKYDGYRKALVGLTTIEEVNRVTSEAS